MVGVYYLYMWCNGETWRMGESLIFCRERHGEEVPGGSNDRPCAYGSQAVPMHASAGISLNQSSSRWYMFVK